VRDRLESRPTEVAAAGSSRTCKTSMTFATSPRAGSSPCSSASRRSTRRRFSDIGAEAIAARGGNADFTRARDEVTQSEGNGFFGGTLSPNLSPRPANGSPFQPTPANSRAAVRVCDFKDLGRKTRKPRTEGSVLANRRLQPLGHLTARVQVYAAQGLTKSRRPLRWPLRILRTAPEKPLTSLSHTIQTSLSRNSGDMFSRGGDTFRPAFSGSNRCRTIKRWRLSSWSGSTPTRSSRLESLAVGG